jgi:hypothetical protein
VSAQRHCVAARARGVERVTCTVMADASLDQLLMFVSSAAEFSDIRIRKGERQVLNDLNKAGRFRQKGKVQSVQVSCR